MKMAKSFLLVSAAGVVAVPGAQAADLPVKAKPVEYVKICSLYGAGFYYIPGTDICMKIGGYVRWQISNNVGSNISGGPFFGTGGRANRFDSQDWSQRTRAHATFDTRQQTAYGTLRTYLLMGFSQDSTVAPSTAPAVYITRGFIQIAGFTFGKATSFFDFTSTAAVSYNAGMLHNSDTGDAGQMVAAYTAQLGNGVSTTFSIEQARRLGSVLIVPGTAGIQYNLQTLANPIGTNMGGLGAANVGLLDFVANLRIDQAWGGAQVSGALHDMRGAYFGFNRNGTLIATEAGDGLGNSRPADRWGWAVSGALRINTPMVGPGNYFQGMVIYSEGATGYLSQTPRGAAWNRWSGNSVGYGFWEDAVYTNPGGATGGSLERTTGWSAFASYEHFWTPALQTSVYGTYIELNHSGAAKAAICDTTAAQFNSTAATNAFFGGVAGGCNPDWSSWAVGTRTQWNIIRGLYVGLDVIYQKLNTATANSANLLQIRTAGGKPSSVYSISDQDAWAATWRIHRDVVP